jgi:hypothetical protein
MFSLALEHTQLLLTAAVDAHHATYPRINSITLPQARQAPWRGWQHSRAAVDVAGTREAAQQQWCLAGVFPVLLVFRVL